MAVLGEKLRWVLRTTQSGLEVESGAVHPSNPVDDSLKIATYGDCPQEAYTVHTWIDVESVHIVLVGFFPCRVYIDSNRRVSRI
jgi:hypothetical protein